MIGADNNYAIPENPIIAGSIWTWDGARFLRVGSGSNPSRLTKGQGYWIYSKTGGALTLQSELSNQ